MDGIPIFDGTNYESWNVEMRNRFSSMDLWRTVQNGYNDEPSEEERQNNAAALSHIRQGVSDWFLPKIEDATTAKQAWDILSELNTKIDLRQTAEKHLIVAALIATVAFTAGFTMPRGYNGNDGPNQGMAILTRKAAFQAFMVTDTIAMSCSILAVITHFDAAITDNQDMLQKQVNKAAYLISNAAVAMVLAFVTGTYVVLAHSSGLAISVCVIGCLPLPFFYATNIMEKVTDPYFFIRSFFGSDPRGSLQSVEVCMWKWFGLGSCMHKSASLLQSLLCLIYFGLFVFFVRVWFLTKPIGLPLQMIGLSSRCQPSWDWV